MNRKTYPYQGDMCTKLQLQKLYNSGMLKATHYDKTVKEGILELLHVENGYAIVNYNGVVRVNRIDGKRFKLDDNWHSLKNFKKYYTRRSLSRSVNK